MKGLVLAGLIAAFGLSGCSKAVDGVAGSAKHGRYVGVGLYPAGRMWSQIVAANPAKEAAASKLSDDEQVVVVLDSNTGEVRQCGNLSGYCVGLNPWARPLAASQVAPLPVAKHATDLDSEGEPTAKPQAR